MKKIFIISLLLMILAMGAVSASENITDEAILTTDDTIELDTNDKDIEENYTWNIAVEENIEILPAPNQSIDVYGVGYTTGNFSLSIDGEKQNITMDYNYIPPIYDAIPYLKFDASKLTLGQHNFDLNFSGDEYQNASSLSGTFTVSPIILNAPSNLHLLNTYENNRDALDNRGYITIKYR